VLKKFLFDEKVSNDIISLFQTDPLVSIMFVSAPAPESETHTNMKAYGLFSRSNS